MKNLLFASVAFMLFFACSNETVFDEKDDSTIDFVTKSINDNGPFNLHDWRIEVIGAIMYHGFDMGPYWSDYESKGKTTFLTGPLTIEETIAQFGGCVGYNILGLTDISNWLYSYLFLVHLMILTQNLMALKRKKRLRGRSLRIGMKEQHL